jgi:DNA-binding response OmpR family regulator
MSDPADATVLVVDDEKTVADTYGHRLQHAYQTETAYGGEAALEVLDETPVDIVLLDRRMPGMTGDEVLREIRDRGYECKVLMVTAIDPDFETLDMPFDDYLCKPVQQDLLMGAVEQQLRVRALERLGEYLRLLAKEEVMAASATADGLADNERYQRLLDEREALAAEISAHVEGFEDLQAAFERLDREP